MNAQWLPGFLMLAAAIFLLPSRAIYVGRVLPQTVHHTRGIPARKVKADRLENAATYDLLAASLRSGMAVAVAANIVGQQAPASLRAPLLRASEKLTLGADPMDAWQVTPDLDEHATALFRMIRRSITAGSSPHDGLRDLASTEREEMAESAAAAAERAGVMISGPLALCFLPAFVSLGIVPVIFGLAGTALKGGLLP